MRRYLHLSPAAFDAAIRLLDAPSGVQVRGEILEAAGIGKGLQLQSTNIFFARFRKPVSTYV